MHRLFVAIRPPEHIRDLLIDAMDDSPDFRWQDDAQLHLTLRFIGEVERPLAEDLAAALGAIRSARFDIRIKGLGRFDQRNSGALWAGLEPKEPLAALAAKVERVRQSRPRARAPNLPPAHHARALERPPQAASWPRTSFSVRPGLTSDPFEVHALRPLRKPPVASRRAYEEAASYPLELSA